MMITGISKNQHWLTNCSYVLLLVWVAPDSPKFKNKKVVTGICKVFSAAVSGYSLLARCKMGVIELIVYKAHALPDFSSGVASLVTSAV